MLSRGNVALPIERSYDVQAFFSWHLVETSHLASFHIVCDRNTGSKRL